LFSLLTMLALGDPHGAAAQDRQRTPPGQGGSTTAFCILPGPDGVVDSPTVPDDETATNGITVGPDGICDSVLTDDDVYSNNGVVTGGGLPHARVISA